METETPKERSERLQVLRQNGDKIIQSETPEEWAERLKILRRNAAERNASETAEEREIKLVSIKYENKPSREN